MRPYVGITGPVTVDEVKAITQEFGKAGYRMLSDHWPMIGFLVSLKTLSRQPTSNRRYPSIDALPGLLAQAADTFTMIHYNSREQQTLVEQVHSVFKGIYGQLCSAVQLNIPWPDTKQVSAIKNEFPGMDIVFQASHAAMEGMTPAEIVKKILKYGSSINYVLIDPSGGRGLEFNIESSARLYKELFNKTTGLTAGFAGGFTGANVADRVNEIKARIDSEFFCIDAEGGLRDKITDTYGDDVLNMKKVRAYLTAASQVLP